MSPFSELVVIAILAQVFMILNYVIGRHAFHKDTVSHEQGTKVSPPTVPYMLPWIGKSLQFFLNPVALVSRITYDPSTDTHSPVRLRLGPQTLYVVQGAKNIRNLWKSPLSTNGTFYLALKLFFGMNNRSSKRYLLDNSGIGHEPAATSNVAPNNRVGHINHQLFSRFLVGQGLAPLSARFERQLVQFRDEITLPERWTEQKDFLELFTINLTQASLRAMCGSMFLELDPDFPQRFWEYSSRMPYFMRGIPRLFAPRSYRIRDSLIKSVMNWHRVAREKFTPECMEADGDADPYWGCTFFRDRHARLSQVDDYDDEAIACEDFAAIWGFHHNVILATFWVAYEVFRDPALLTRFRSEIRSCADSNSPTGFDADKLVKVPLLQSVWAETLRLRVHIFNTRQTAAKDVSINNWVVPKESLAIVSSTPAHFDRHEWNQGRNNEHPVETFWADRFVVYPDDPLSGPKRNMSGKRPAHFEGDANAPYFLLDSSMSGAWIPFGGGGYTCPGRHFAKREALLTCAVLASSANIEIGAAGMDAKMDWSKAGYGTLKPESAVPFRMQKRTGGLEA